MPHKCRMLGSASSGVGMRAGFVVLQLMFPGNTSPNCCTFRDPDPAFKWEPVHETSDQIGKVNGAPKPTIEEVALRFVRLAHCR